MDQTSTQEALSLLRAILALGRRMRAERAPDAPTLAGVSILGTLARLGPIAATRLAAEERLRPQSLTRILAALERDGLIRRATGEPPDRRVVTVALTPRGRAVLAADLRARQDWLERAIATALDAEERGILLAAAAPMARLAFAGDDAARPRP